MKKITKIFAVLLITVFTISSLSGCAPAIVGMFSVADMINNGGDLGQNNIIEDILTEETTEGYTFETDTKPKEDEDVTTSSSGSGILNVESIPEYIHYYPKSFNEKCAEMEELAKDGKSDEALKLYDELYAEACDMQDNYTVIDILSYEDASNETYKSEDEYMHDVLIDSVDIFDLACNSMMKSDISKDFEKHLNDDYLIEYYETYEKTPDEAKELMSEEEKLENEYTTIMDDMGEITYKLDGTDYKFEDLLDYENCDLYYSDQDKFFEAYYGCYEELNNQAGEIFVQLVKIRDQIAKLNGYDNYNDYADENLYGRDYSFRDLEKMKQAVREFGAEYQNYMYYAYYALPEYNKDGDSLVDEGGDVLSGISPLVDKAYQYISDNRLYSIGDDENRTDAGFTTSFIKGNIPFIFIKTSDNAYDMITLTHEFGHFTDAYWNPNPYPLYMTGSYDLFEIHSTGLQLLSSDNYSELFGNDATTVKAFNLLNLMSYISDGCMYDEWQREIYKNPDMTLDEINDLYEEISEEYGVAPYEGQKYAWVEVQHNFTSPLYYVSYATSAFASLQIWLLSNESYGDAVSVWENIVKAGAYEDGYMDVVKDAGLKQFNDTDAVYDVLDRTYTEAVSLLYGSIE